MIEVRNLSVTLADKPILENYSLSVERGGVLAILGANGVGKTTLLNCIVGLRRPSSGTALSRGRIGYVPQLFHSTFAFSVLDIVLMGRARHIGLFGAPRARDYEVAGKHLNLMKVGHLRDRSFNELSGGQRQLVMIAQALSSECEVMILDEPCSALDYKNQSIVIETLRRLNGEMGLTIVFSTHAPQHGLEVATHVLLMNDRRRYQYGPVEEILTAENLSTLYEVAIAKAAFADGGRFTFAPYFSHPAPCVLRQAQHEGRP
jgi:iron complex transport system ATP-binding protein